MERLKPDLIKLFLMERMQIPRSEVDERLNNISEGLIKRWNESGYDFQIYKHPDYLLDCVNCYIKFTKQAVKSAYKILNGERINSILDYYNGVGLSTIQMRLMWPDSVVHFFNDNPEQRKFMMDYKKRLIIPGRIEDESLPSYDLIFLLEVLEHYRNPEDFFREVIDKRCGRFLVITAPFQSIAPGHFPDYHGIPGKNYGKRFRRFLHESGFELYGKGFNSFPMVYEKRGGGRK